MEAFQNFLFESTILLFKDEKLREAASAAFQTFCSNPYWIGRFLGRRWFDWTSGTPPTLCR